MGNATEMHTEHEENTDEQEAAYTNTVLYQHNSYLITCFTMIHKNIILAHIVNLWNSLSNSVVDVDTFSIFKARLDTFWMHQEDVKYDFTAVRFLVCSSTQKCSSK